MAGVELATAYVSIAPSAKGIAANLARELNGPADQAGRQAGQRIEDGIEGGAKRGAQNAASTLGQILGGAAVVAGIGKLTDAASGLQQAVGGTAAVFGEASDAVDEFAAGAAESVGLSERAAREATSQLGALFKGFGFAAEEAAQKAIELTTIGADLAATFGGTTAEAVQALSAALRGESDPIERYGISLRQADVNARAVALGLAESATSVDAHAKAVATLAIVTEDSAGALGQFSREAGSAAGQAQIASAGAENAAASFGDSLLPIMAKATEALGFLASGFGALPDEVQTGLVAIAGIAAVAGPLGTAKDSVKGLGQAFKDLPRSARIAAGGLALVATAFIEIQNLASNEAALSERFFDALTEGGGLASRALTELVNEGLRGAGVFDDFAAAGLSASEFIAATAADLDGSSQELADFFDAFEEGGGNIASLSNNELTLLNRALRDALTNFGNVKNGIDETEVAAAQAAGSLGEVESATTNAAEAAEEYADELDDAIANLKEVFGLQSSASEASIAFRDTLRDIADQAVSVADGTLVGSERVDAFAGLLIEGRDNALEYAEALIRTGSTTDEAILATQGLIDELFAAADQSGLTGDEVAFLRGELGLMPEQVRIAIESNLPQLAADVAVLEANIRALIEAWGSDFTADVGRGPRVGSGGGVAQFDTGGWVDQVPVGVPMPAIVHGGELILNPKQQAEVFAPSGRGDSRPIVIYEAYSAEDTAKHVDQILALSI